VIEQVKRIAVLIFLIVNLGVALAVSYTEYVLFNRFDEAFLSARILNKGVLLIVSQPQCVFSAFLRQEVLSEENVSNFLRNHYVVVEIYPDPDLTGHFNFDMYETFFSIEGKIYTYEDLYNIFLLRGTPTNAYFSKDLKLLSSFTGSVPPTEYLQIAKYLSQNLFQSGVDWEQYKKKEDPYLGVSELKPITATEREYLLKNAKNIRSVTLEELASTEHSLDPHLYYIIEKATEEEIRGFLNQIGLTLYSVYWLKKDSE